MDLGGLTQRPLKVSISSNSDSAINAVSNESVKTSAWSSNLKTDGGDDLSPVAPRRSEVSCVGIESRSLDLEAAERRQSASSGEIPSAAHPGNSGGDIFNQAGPLIAGGYTVLVSGNERPDNGSVNGVVS